MGSNNSTPYYSTRIREDTEFHCDRAYYDEKIRPIYNADYGTVRVLPEPAYNPHNGQIM